MPKGRSRFSAKTSGVAGPPLAASAGKTRMRPLAAFRHEDIAVRCDPDDARLFQALGEHLHREALRHIRHLALRCFDNLRHSLEIRLFGVVVMMARRRQVGGPDVPAYARGIALPGAEGIGAGTHLLRVQGRQRNERQRKTYQHRRRAHKFLWRMLCSHALCSTVPTPPGQKVPGERRQMQPSPRWRARAADSRARFRVPCGHVRAKSRGSFFRCTNSREGAEFEPILQKPAVTRIHTLIELQPLIDLQQAAKTSWTYLLLDTNKKSDGRRTN